MIADAFEALNSPATWRAFTSEHPAGLWWRNAGPLALRQIIAEMQFWLAPHGVLVALDEKHDAYLPRSVIVVHGDDTKLVPLKFRDQLAFVDGKPVATLHSGGAFILAKTIVNAVARAIGVETPNTHTKEHT